MLSMLYARNNYSGGVHSVCLVNIYPARKEILAQIPFVTCAYIPIFDEWLLFCGNKCSSNLYNRPTDPINNGATVQKTGVPYFPL